jgi:hypothetical protein
MADCRARQAEALEALDDRRERRGEGQLLDGPIEFVPTLQLVGQERMILSVHQTVFGRQRRGVGGEMQQPPEMGRAPVGALPIDEAPASQELEDIVPGLEDLALKRLPATHDIPDPFLRFRRNAHGRELARAIEAGEIGRIALVVLPLDARPLGDERGGNDVAGVSPLAQRAMQHVAGAAGFVAGAEFPVARGAFEPALQLREIVGEPLEAGRRLGRLRQHGDGDGVLVHIHPEVNDSGRCGS